MSVLNYSSTRMPESNDFRLNVGSISSRT